MELADAFLEDVVGGATKIACHRGASNIRQEDIGFYLGECPGMHVAKTHPHVSGPKAVIAKSLAPTCTGDSCA